LDVCNPYMLFACFFLSVLNTFVLVTAANSLLDDWVSIIGLCLRYNDRYATDDPPSAWSGDKSIQTCLYLVYFKFFFADSGLGLGMNFVV